MSNSDFRIDRGLLRWIALGVGLIALIVMLVAQIATPGPRFTTTSYVALGIAILGIATFVLLDPEALVQSITGRTGVYTITSWVMVLFFIAVIVGLYMVVLEADVEPITLGENSQYRLSDDTIAMLEGLQEPVEATAFIAQNNVTTREEAEIWLQKYQAASNGMFTYRFVDPDQSPSIAQQLEMSRPGVIVLSQGERKAEASFASQSNLTTALNQVQLGEPRVAYFITGHSERDINDFSASGFTEAVSMLERLNFTVETLALLTEGQIPDDADLLIIASPQAQFSRAEVDAIDAFLESGGAMLVMFDPGGAGGTFGLGVQGVTYSSTGNRLATAGADGTAKIWDANNLLEPLLTLRGHGADVMDVDFHPDEFDLATVGRDGTIRIWNAATGEQTYVLEGQTAQAIRLTYTADGQYLVSIGQDQAINVWSTENYELMDYAPIPTTTQLLAVEAAPDGSTFAVAAGRETQAGGITGTVYVYDAATGEELVAQDLHIDVIQDIAFSPDGQTIYSVSRDGTQGTLELANPDDATVESIYEDDGISAIAVLPDGTRAYALLSDFTIHVVAPDADPGDDDLVLEGHTRQIWKIDVAPDGSEFASGSRDGNVNIWLPNQTEPRLTITAHTGGDQLLTYLVETWGINVNDDVVVEPQGQFYGFDVLTAVADPNNPDSFNAQSPVVQDVMDQPLPSVFFLGRSLDIIELDTLSVEQNELVFTSAGDPPNGSWGETNANANAEYSPEEDSAGPLTLAVSAENLVSEARIIVVGDSDFAANQGMQQSNFSNQLLLTSMVNWLLNENFTFINENTLSRRALDPPYTQGALIVVSIASICLLPVIFLVTGAVLWFIRRRRR